MFQEGRNGAEPPEGHRHLIQIFYKNLTASWQQPIPFPLDHARVNCCSGAGRFVGEHYNNEMKQFITVCVLMTVEIMSAATLNIRWTDCDRNQSLPVVLGSQNPCFNVGIEPRERHCPSCDSIVYSRRHSLCGVCGEALPKDCLFTATEAENVEMLLRAERQRHRAWLKKTTAE